MIGSRRFDIIAATDIANGIGQNNKMPWQIKAEILYFKKMTTFCPAGMYNAVIMGRKTYLSLPKRHRPLKHRLNLVLSRQQLDPASVDEQAVLPSLEAALSRLSIEDNVHRIFVIGGQATYETAIQHHKLDGIYRSRIHKSFECDTFFPEIPSGFKRTQTSGVLETPDGAITFETWRRR